MAGTSEDARAFVDGILNAGETPAWTGAGDLSRLSIEAFARRDWSERPRSGGTLRLLGEGVRDSTAPLDAVGAICQGFQRVVMATGAALEGVRSTRGRISEALQRRTRLSLEATPALGSIVLRLAPEMDPNDERHDRRMPSMLGDDPEPLADQSVSMVVALLRLASSEQPDGEALASLLLDVGPRVSAAVGDLAKALADESFDVDLSWSQPERPTQRVSVTAPQARWLEDFVSSRRLDAAEIVVRGTLRTISDRRALELETDEGDLAYLRLPEDASVTSTQLENLRVHDRVEAVVMERIEYKVGGGELRTHSLVSLRKLGA